MKRVVGLVAALVVGSAIVANVSVSEARQYGAGGKVVHTRRMPVVLHRMVPPQYGKHVYAGR